MSCLGAATGRPSEHFFTPMRDGVKLTADFYRSPDAGKVSVLLMRTPYNKAGIKSTAEKYAAAGYDVIVKDARGRYESGGVFYPYKRRSGRLRHA